MSVTVEAATQEQATKDSNRTLAESLDTVVARLSSAQRHAVGELAEDDRVTIPQLRCVQQLAVTGSGLTTQLARAMEVAVPTMTGRIDGLVARGFVERHPDSEDRRKIHLVRTDAGRAQLERSQVTVLSRLQRLLSPLSPDQRERLHAAVQDLLTVTSRHWPQPRR